MGVFNWIMVTYLFFRIHLIGIGHCKVPNPLQEGTVAQMERDNAVRMSGCAH